LLQRIKKKGMTIYVLADQQQLMKYITQYYRVAIALKDKEPYEDFHVDWKRSVSSF
jgi:hypothetical protein